MPRSKRSRKYKNMKGGLFGLFEGDSSSGASSGASSVGSWFSGLTEKAKSATGSSSWFSSTPAAESAAPAAPQQESYSPPIQGGKRRRRRMRGGYSENSGNSSLANNAGSYSGPTARAHANVGGTRKCCKKHNKSHKKRYHRH